MELGVRAATSDYMLSLNKRIDRALRAGADSIGAQVEIRDIGAYLPTHQDSGLCQVFARNAALLVGEERGNRRC